MDPYVMSFKRFVLWVVLIAMGWGLATQVIGCVREHDRRRDSYFYQQSVQ